MVDKGESPSIGETMCTEAFSVEFFEFFGVDELADLKVAE